MHLGKHWMEQMKLLYSVCLYQAAGHFGFPRDCRTLSSQVPCTGRIVSRGSSTTSTHSNAAGGACEPPSHWRDAYFCGPSKPTSHCTAGADNVTEQETVLTPALGPLCVPKYLDDHSHPPLRVWSHFLPPEPFGLGFPPASLLLPIPALSPVPLSLCAGRTLASVLLFSLVGWEEGVGSLMWVRGRGTPTSSFWPCLARTQGSVLSGTFH